MGLLESVLGNKSEEFPSRERARELWNQVFGAPKEPSDPRALDPHKVRPGGSWGRGMLSEPLAQKRLHQALRSKAPGGWSDNKFEQERHLEGIFYTVVHRCNEILSESEFQVYEKDDNHADGMRPVRKGHPGYDLTKLLERPNPQDTFGDMLTEWNTQMVSTGLSLTWLVPNALKRPYEMYPIPTGLAIPQPAINPDYPDGFYRIQPIYPYGPFSSYPTPASAVGAPIDARQIMRMKYVHPLLRYEGMSPQTAMRFHLDVVQMIDKARHYGMRKQFNPNAVLNFDDMEEAQPLPEAEIERIKAEFEENHEGVENNGKLYVAAPGSHLEKWESNFQELQAMEGWEQVTGLVMAAIGVTKAAAGMTDSSTYATLFATLKQLYWLTLGPTTNRFGQRLTRDVAPYFGDDLVVKVRCKRIDDHEILFQEVDKLMQGKAIKKNELRKKLNFPLTQEPWGEDMAGDPSPKEEEQQQQQQQQQQQSAMQVGPAGGGGPPTPSPGNPTQGTPPGQDEDAIQTQPSPEGLSQGALGPKMKGLRMKYAKRYGLNGHAVNGRA